MSNDQLASQDIAEPFDEDWYLNKYPAIAEVVQRGGFKSGREHYMLHGRFEGRIPVPPANYLEDTVEGLLPPRDKHNRAGFLAPSDLAVSPTPLNRIVLIGSCMIESWGFQDGRRFGCPADLIVVNNTARLPELTPAAVQSYDFAVIQLPLRGLFGDATLWHYGYADAAAYEAEFQRCCNQIEYNLNNWMQWNHEFGLLTFVANFYLPQQNPMGRLFPRFSLANPEYFISRLNEHLETVVRRSRNAYVLDLDRLTASVGRRYMQDDFVTVISHNGGFGGGGSSSSRIEPLAPFQDHYDHTWPAAMSELAHAELLAMYRTIRQIDPVKVVVVDLDDTLWNGVSGDMSEVDGTMVEGWPIGLAEALMYLKKRGILLAIASKNEESRIREIWPRIFGNRLRLDDFAAIRINWRPKAENMREILEGMNLLSRNAVFIDDNPAEQEAMRREFPDMRILGRYPYYLKRILLWSPETQVAVVTDESGRRTEMIQAQFARETQRREVSRDQFLHDAAPTVTILSVDGVGHERFPRVFELINKTNQFNTTGRRWKIEEFEEFMRSGGRMLAFEVTDRFTFYGLVGVVLFRPGHIEQWVMSCRVLGYQIEDAVMANVIAAMRVSGPCAVTGRLVHTDVNFPCRGLFRDCGFKAMNDSGDWVLSADQAIEIPGHITMTLAT